MLETEFIDKWRGKESVHWIQDACSLFWARSYKMSPTELLGMSIDYLSIDIENRAPCARSLAHRTIHQG